MSTYSTQTVAQLKELLKANGLPTNGVKSDLIARLEKADATAADGTSAEAEPAVTEATSVTDQTTQEPVTAPTTASAEEELLEIDEEAKGPAESEKSKENDEGQKVEEKKVLTPEERKAAAVDLLTKRIARAKKFGTEEDVVKAEKDLARVEKFGVDLGTALAREIGLASAEGLNEKPRHRRGHGHGKDKRGFKGSRR